MRIWGRTADGKWQAVTTAANGDNTYVYITALVQALKLNLGESPFYGNVGLPAQQCVITQILPDFYLSQLQARYAGYFASLVISDRPTTGLNPDPIYDINVVTKQGTTIPLTIAT
jgi:hypothetical protein